MNIEKQTLYNTEELKELYERRKRAVEGFDKDKKYGGIRFLLRRRSEVKLGVEFLSVGGKATLYLDSYRVGGIKMPFFEMTVILEKGEHCFEVVCPATHGGLRVYAEGVSLDRDHCFADRVGGCQTSEETVAYVKNGNRFVTKYLYANGALSVTELNDLFRDEAYLYDRTNGVYTTTKCPIFTQDATQLTVYTGVNQSLVNTTVKSAAICDARTLEAGADFLVAYTDAGDNLHVLRTTEEVIYDTSCFLTPIKGIHRVLSAQKGSILLVEDSNHCWYGYYFHASGSNRLAFPQHTFRYDKIPLVRNRFCSPSATINETTGAPIFWYQKEDGCLMRLAYGGTPTVVGYADGWCPTAGGALVQVGSDLSYYAE